MLPALGVRRSAFGSWCPSRTPERPTPIMLITDPTHAPPRRLILASQSPRRQELLKLLGWPFDVIPSEVDEGTAPEELEPAALAAWLAEQKARDVAVRYPGAFVIG